MQGFHYKYANKHAELAEPEPLVKCVFKDTIRVGKLYHCEFEILLSYDKAAVGLLRLVDADGNCLTLTTWPYFARCNGT
jgi:hypothetical protein